MKIKWDETGKRLFETGTNKGVLFVKDATGAYGAGVPWNGLTSIKQSPDGAEPTPIFADNIKYLELMSAENFKGTIDAYTYPDEFMACEGSQEIVADSGVFAAQQERAGFGLVYSTIIGNDTVGNDYGEKIHLIYNAKVSPAARDYETINDTPNAITMSWAFTTVPVAVDDIPLLKRPTAYITIDSTKVATAKMTAIRELIYGTEALEPKFPSLAELMALLTPAG